MGVKYSEWDLFSNTGGEHVAIYSESHIKYRHPIHHMVLLKVGGPLS